MVCYFKRICGINQAEDRVTWPDALHRHTIALASFREWSVVSAWLRIRAQPWNPCQTRNSASASTCLHQPNARNAWSAHVDPARRLDPQCQWIGLWRLCAAVYLFTPPAGPLHLRARALQRMLMERFFCGTCRNRERWLVSIYRSMTHCCEIGACGLTSRGHAWVVWPIKCK